MTNAELEAIAGTGLSWIKVKRLGEPSGIVEDDYRNLVVHHLNETEFLIAKCRELASEILAERERNTRMKMDFKYDN